MKVLFLDIDGVLNSAQSAHFFHRERLLAKAGHPGFLDALGRRALRSEELCPIAVSNLLFILEKVPDLKIVVSSTWRLGREVSELKALLGHIGVPEEVVIGKTPCLPPVDGHSAKRGNEIQKWIDSWNGLGSLTPVDEFVIVDDDADMEHLLGNLVQTDHCVGLDFRKAWEIIKRFEPAEDIDASVLD
jgi:hypothetical protein